MMNLIEQEKLYDYELIEFGGHPVNRIQRKYRTFRFTESEAQEKNQAYSLNRVHKRLVRIKARFN